MKEQLKRMMDDTQNDRYNIGRMILVPRLLQRIAEM